MGLYKDSRALLVKLFYQNNNSSAAALREYLRIKGIRRDPLSVPELKNMIRRFELIGDLGISPRRGRLSVASEIVEAVTVAMAENAGRNVRSSSSEDRTLFPASDSPGAILKSPVNSNLRIMFFNPGTERGPLRII